jgi:hypothetical protein
MSSNRTMTEHEAYLAMFAFLASEYDLSKSDALGVLLGSMSLLPNGSPADPAILQQWRDACAKAARGEVSATLRVSK